MKTVDRRNNIIKDLNKSDIALKGTILAEKYSVSRQVIVQDIAILKASGEKIISTSSGYIINNSLSLNGIIKRVPVIHKTEDTERELEIIVRNGAVVKNVVIEHPIYGELKGNLDIKNHSDIKEFILRTQDKSKLLLMNLTSGVHIHKIEVANEKSYQKIICELDKEEFLLK